MDYFTLGAVVWLAIFLLLGVLKGFWNSLAAALSLFIAYWASAYFSPPLAAFAAEHFSNIALGETVWWGIAATVIFILTTIVVRLIVLTIGRSIPLGGSVGRLAGGFVSAGYGAVIGAFLLWGLAFLADSWSSHRRQSGHEVDERWNTDSSAVTWSRMMVSRWVNWNIRQSGGSDAFAGFSAAIANSPSKVLGDIQAAMRSSEFQEMVSNEKIQTLVAERNVQSLGKSEEFRRFLSHPAVKELRLQVAPEADGWSEEKIAEETIDIWNRIQTMRMQPQIASLLDDSEVQSFLRGNAKMTPSLIAKGQQLMSLLNQDLPLQPLKPVPKLFQWHDDEGHLHVTEEHEIPSYKKSEATPLDF